MAKKFTHTTCGREFRTRNGLATHVICNPIAKTPASPTQVENAPARSKAMTARNRKGMIETATEYYMRTYELGFVKANIRARKLVASGTRS